MLSCVFPQKQHRGYFCLQLNFAINADCMEKNPALPSLTTAYTKFYQDFNNKSSFSFNVKEFVEFEEFKGAIVTAILT